MPVAKEGFNLFRTIEIKESTYRRLRKHSLYYCENTGNTYNDIIIKTLDCWEQNHDEEEEEDNEIDSWIG